MFAIPFFVRSYLQGVHKPLMVLKIILNHCLLKNVFYLHTKIHSFMEFKLIAQLHFENNVHVRATLIFQTLFNCSLEGTNYLL